MKWWRRFREWMAEPSLGEAIVMHVMAREERERDMEQGIARLRAALVAARVEITRLATDGGGFSCAVIDEIDEALKETE